MNMLVGSNEKLAVGISGNGQVAELDTVSLAVYTNGENSAQGATNMPNIQFEIDPNLAPSTSTSNFSTMTFVANNTSPGQWATVDATDPADGSWFLTGAAGTAIGCTQATTCSLADVKTKLNDGGGCRDDPHADGQQGPGLGLLDGRRRRPPRQQPGRPLRGGRHHSQGRVTQSNTQVAHL